MNLAPPGQLYVNVRLSGDPQAQILALFPKKKSSLPATLTPTSSPTTSARPLQPKQQCPHFEAWREESFDPAVSP